MLYTTRRCSWLQRGHPLTPQADAGVRRSSSRRILTGPPPWMPVVPWGQVRWNSRAFAGSIVASLGEVSSKCVQCGEPHGFRPNPQLAFLLTAATAGRLAGSARFRGRVKPLSQVGREVLRAAHVTTKVQVEPRVFGCEFSGFSG